MVGKAPYYKNDVLYLDDIYLMTMAASPLFSSLMRQLWDQRWPAGSFADQWLADADVIKGKLKKERAFAKILALGLSYGMGPAKMVTSAYDKGYTLSLTEAKAFHRAYWELFSEVRRFSNALAARVEASGSIVNPFGYRLTPEPFKAFNAFIQSSVSGVIHVLRAKIAAQAPYALMDTVIHDELLYDVPTTMLEQFRKDKELATDSLNEDLAWSIKIRSGFAPGQTWYEAK
jgi:DNA polymerase I-like protein with 3'-5' exonuclease and polymerase domains